MNQGDISDFEYASEYTSNGTTVLAGEKNGYSVSMMIMDNTLGGEEKTMLQIVIEIIDD